MLATKVACPRCFRKLKTPRPVAVGKHLRCSRCDHSFTVRAEDMLNPTAADAMAVTEQLPSVDGLDLSRRDVGGDAGDDCATELIVPAWEATKSETPVATMAAPLPDVVPGPAMAKPVVPLMPARKRASWLAPVLIVACLVLITGIAVALTLYLGRLGAPAQPAEKEEPLTADPEPSYSPVATVPLPPAKDNPPAAQTPDPPPSLESLPPEERDRIKKAIERGVAFLRKSQLPEGTWKGGPAVGLAALPGLTLLECGVPAGDPQVQKAAAYVRKGGPTLQKTYEIALAILFLDRLGEPADEGLIQSLALRLIGGQTAAGGWHYDCLPLSKEDEGKFLAALRETQPRSTGDLFVAGPDGRKPDWFAQGPDQPGPPVDHAKVLATLPRTLQHIPALQTPVPGKPFPAGDASDNSNTQFAALGLWVAGRHGIPIERALALLATRFRTSQAVDGGWNYSYNPRGASSAAMTGAGLIGLAMGHGLVANHTAPPADTGSQPTQRVAPDASLAKGLTAIASHIGEVQEKRGRKGQHTINLYFLWTLERVAMLYNLPKVNGKDWYRWGAQELVELQKDQGNWDTAGYPGSGAVIDTSLALLFLQRANVAKDLTRKIEHLGRVREREQ